MPVQRSGEFYRDKARVRSRRVSFRCSVEADCLLEAISNHLGVSRSAVIEMAVREAARAFDIEVSDSVLRYASELGYESKDLAHMRNQEETDHEQNLRQIAIAMAQKALEKEMP